jgi:hypothetical protein
MFLTFTSRRHPQYTKRTYKVGEQRENTKNYLFNVEEFPHSVIKFTA